MIITKKKALAFVGSNKVIKVLPELFHVAEKYRDKQKEFEKKKGCPKCKVSDFFSTVEDAAMTALSSMSPESVKKLQALLETTEPLYLYISGPGGVKMKELGK